MDPKPLPAHPSLEQYKKQAKDLLKAYRSADVETIRRVKKSHPRFEKLAEPWDLTSANLHWLMRNWSSRASMALKAGRNLRNALK